MNERMVVEKTSTGYLAVGVESPGIIISADTKEELVRLFRKAVPSYKRGLKWYGVKDKPREIVNVTI